MIANKPDLNAPDDDWSEYAELGCNYLESKLLPYLAERFGYTADSDEHTLYSWLGSTVKATGEGYDLYLRLFPTPKAGWPRETVVIARVDFRNELRKGHGRNLLALLVDAAYVVGYKYIAIECTNKQSQAFGTRFGLNRMGDSVHWIGSVDCVQRKLG